MPLRIFSGSVDHEQVRRAESHPGGRHAGLSGVAESQDRGLPGPPCLTAPLRREGGVLSGQGGHGLQPRDLSRQPVPSLPRPGGPQPDPPGTGGDSSRNRTGCRALLGSLDYPRLRPGRVARTGRPDPDRLGPALGNGSLLGAGSVSRRCLRGPPDPREGDDRGSGFLEE